MNLGSGFEAEGRVNWERESGGWELVPTPPFPWLPSFFPGAWQGCICFPGVPFHLRAHASVTWQRCLGSSMTHTQHLS